MTVVIIEREERLTVRGDGKAEIVSERVSEGEWDVSAKRLYECLEHGCGRVRKSADEGNDRSDRKGDESRERVRETEEKEFTI